MEDGSVIAGLVMTTDPGGSWGGNSVFCGALVVVLVPFPVVFWVPEAVSSDSSADWVLPAVLKSDVLGGFLVELLVGVGVSSAGAGVTSKKQQCRL